MGWVFCTIVSKRWVVFLPLFWSIWFLFGVF